MIWTCKIHGYNYLVLLHTTREKVKIQDTYRYIQYIDALRCSGRRRREDILDSSALRDEC